MRYTKVDKSEGWRSPNFPPAARSPVLRGVEDGKNWGKPAGVRAQKISGEALVFVVFLIFSFWLMFHTVGYDGENHTTLVASKLWSDFGSHIPLIRSFSMGNNWPPEYPLFPGEPMRYHFLFYALVGLLEKTCLPAGRPCLRLDWALNVPSALGFTLLLWGIWSLAKNLFGDTRIAGLSVLFFLFNGSLSFLTFFQRQPLNLRDFPAFGPWDGGQIAAFWNLNIYTNQRHLALAFAMGLLFISWVIQKGDAFVRENPKFEYRNPKQTRANSKVLNSDQFRILNFFQFKFVSNFVLRASNFCSSFLWGIAIGLLPSFHQPMLPIFAILLVWYFLVFPRQRLSLAIAGLTAILLILPQLKTMSSFGISNFEHWNLFRISDFVLRIFSVWYPGYLIHDRFAITNFLSYWFQNLGLHAILIPLGFLLLPLRAKKVLMPLLFIFVIGNLFKFSLEVAANHKFFNFALILGNIITAYTIVALARKIGSIGSIGLLVVLVVFLTLSGVIDFLVIAGDTKGALPDVGNNKAATWIASNTPADTVFLNSSFLYHPASLAGRKIFLGWPYFAWSAGYDTYGRMANMKTMYESKDPAVFCPLLTKHNISFVTVEDTKGDPNLPHIDTNYFETLAKPVFVDPTTSLAIYQTADLCQ